jgi:hypothetical protein
MDYQVDTIFLWCHRAAQNPSISSFQVNSNKAIDYSNFYRQKLFLSATRCWGFFLSIAIFLACIGSAHALDTRPLSIAELTMRSDVIAIGTIASVAGDWNSNKTAIYTRMDLKVEERLKGTDLEDKISFFQLGGSAGDTVSAVAGAAPFRPGERVAVFLYKDREQRLQLVGLFQGKFSVEKRPGSEDEIAVRRIPEVAKPLDEMPLERLKNLVQTAPVK